jgi:hypothetical protein
LVSRSFVIIDHPQILNYLTDRVKLFDGGASKHRLNQCPQNPALQSATKVKEKLSLLKSQNKDDGIDLSVNLWVYPVKTGAAPKKAHLQSFPAHFKSNVSADHMFDEMLKKVERAYQNSPAGLTLSANARPVFQRYA